MGKIRSFKTTEKILNFINDYKNRRIVESGA